MQGGQPIDVLTVVLQPDQPIVAVPADNHLPERHTLDQPMSAHPVVTTSHRLAASSAGQAKAVHDADKPSLPL